MTERRVGMIWMGGAAAVGAEERSDALPQPRLPPSTHRLPSRSKVARRVLTHLRPVGMGRLTRQAAWSTRSNPYVLVWPSL